MNHEDTSKFEGLARVRIEGLGSLSDVELRPGRLTVLIGPNGSGKSNVLRALQMAPLIRTLSLQRFVGNAGGASALLHYGPKRTQALSIRLEFDQGGNRNSYVARLAFAAGDRLMFTDESVEFASNATSYEEPHALSIGAGHWESMLREQEGANATVRCVNWWIRNMTFFHFHDTSVQSQLRTNARAADDQFLRSDGSNLAAFLHRMHTSEDDADRAAWHRIHNLVRRVAPAVKELRPTPTNGGEQSIRLDWIDDQDEIFGVHQLSDGTLRAIALITALAQPTRSLPKFISIDEPELGLHPSAIAILAELARSVSRHCQVLFATQSTAFLDQFEPEEVVVAERSAGATTLRRLDSNDLREWLSDYSLSEIFNKGIIGGRP